MADIRRATEGDALAIHQVLVEAFQSFRPLYTAACFDATVLDAERVLRRIREGPVFVAEQDGIVGTVGLVQDARGWYLRGLGVHPTARGTGVATALMQACEHHVRAAGGASVWLSTTTFLDGSIALYQHLGYEDAPGPADLHGTALRSFEKRL